MDEKLSPIHPGEILMEEFLKPMNISQYKLAKDISVPPRRINEIVHGLRAITRAIQSIYHDAIRGKLAKYESWCDYVE